MRVEFSPEARSEFEDGENYYERQQAGLAGVFARKSGRRCRACVTRPWRRQSNAATSVALC